MAKNGSVFVWVAVSGVLLYLLFAGNTGILANANIDLSQFIGSYPADNVNALGNLYAVLLRSTDPNTGQSLSPFQNQILLSQALVESGLFTSNPNWTMINGNNFSGITAHGSYPANENGRFAKYPNIQTFVNDWLNILNYNNQPIEATTVNDFNNRLKQNGYYGSDSTITYGSNLQIYYDLLTQVSA